MKNFADRLIEKIAAFNNPTVMGLDPKLDFIPQHIIDSCNKQTDNNQIASAMAIFEFNRMLIDATYDIIPAIKPQFAYYEMYGIYGLETLHKTVSYAKSKGMIVIADAKRNDIGSTAEAYAAGILGSTILSDSSSVSMLDADAITVNAYLGIDGIEPFVKVAKEQGKGVFILVRTSNPSAGDFQDLTLQDGRKLYEAVADRINIWGSDLIGENGFSSIGAVVGATWPEQASDLRNRMPSAFILVPGYGAQGGSADTAACSFSQNGTGAIVNASRSLMCAYKKRSDLNETEFQIATRDEAIRMRDDINDALLKKTK
jgi:orotidine-5'-phosphate decarboxylase